MTHGPGFADGVVTLDTLFAPLLRTFAAGLEFWQEVALCLVAIVKNRW